MENSFDDKVMFQSGLPLKASRFRGPFRRESSFSAEPVPHWSALNVRPALGRCTHALRTECPYKKSRSSLPTENGTAGQRRTLSGFSAFMDLLFHRPPFLPIHTIQKKRGQGFGKPKSLWRGGGSFSSEKSPRPSSSINRP
ncbi:hypothetical protein [Bilophila wadsworthia]|jgi:hypothetical protein|uniref:hypothetical protein n=1 Tax=Bilophila wadsworthia TaxID=35833 RepID=UPI001D0AD248|nr:hypothetical protein [Bilophila wadsworthia]